jgi:Fe-S-cluster containining protein
MGIRRREFCKEYIKKKKNILLLVEESQAKKAAEAGKSISCQLGCTFCCSQCISASIQECEAIVYYLYQNEKLLHKFLGAYQKWRAITREKGDLFNKINAGWDVEADSESELIKKYYLQDIQCPFLNNGSCIIYEVRPYACAALSSVSPPDWCRPNSLNKPETFQVYVPEIYFDFSFYYGEFNTIILTFMPLTIYEILKNGPSYLSQVVPGLENLAIEFYADADVLSLLKKYGIRRDQLVVRH